MFTIERISEDESIYELAHFDTQSEAELALECLRADMCGESVDATAFRTAHNFNGARLISYVSYVVTGINIILPD